MRGVILAGGKGTRLMPLTASVNKHLLPVGDRAMIEYPLSTLREIGVDEVLIVTNPEHVADFKRHFDSHAPSASISFAVQDGARGIAHALASAEAFAEAAPVTVILGDNIFGSTFSQVKPLESRARLWVRSVDDPTPFGILTETAEGTRILEKPAVPSSHRAVVGLYQYPPDVFEMIRRVPLSLRGEYEITDLNNIYLAEQRCEIEEVMQSMYWCDAGTIESLRRASEWAQKRRAVDSVTRQ